MPINHLENWLKDFIYFGMAAFPVHNLIPPKTYYFLDQSLYRFFVFLKLLAPNGKIDYQKISLRTTVFIDEAKKFGLIVKSLDSPFGPSNHFEMEWPGKKHYFEGLPRVEQLENQTSKIIDDKMAVKKMLQENGLPTAEGKSFWWFQKKLAAAWTRKFGWPVIVKPRLGSMSHHLTANINNETALIKAIEKATRYSPAFIIERFVPNVSTYRATVIDFNKVACVKRIPAQVIGNGAQTIQELVERKNRDPRRGNPKQKDTTLYKLVINETSHRLLQNQNYSLPSVPAAGEIVWLQEKVILDLGADLREETSRIHPDNLELFQKVAELFNVRLVGIDFLIQDISRSWKTAPSAIIELNSLPYIDMHHFPTEGQPVKAAAFLCQMVKKYY